MNNLQWIFDGIGTEILSLIIGIVIGVVGDRFILKSRNKQTQRAGRNSTQMQASVTGSTTGDIVYGDKIISGGKDTFDVHNLPHYTLAQIEAVIQKGNDATRRKWCLELIANGKPDHLIKKCVQCMENEKEKLNLLRKLAEYGYADTEYFRMLLSSLNNGVYQDRAIALCIFLRNRDGIVQTFQRITNNEYICKALIQIYHYDRNLFENLYQNGECFSDEDYDRKLRSALKL